MLNIHSQIKQKKAKTKLCALAAEIDFTFPFPSEIGLLILGEKLWLYLKNELIENNKVAEFVCLHL